jgi:hypothetical protein
MKTTIKIGIVGLSIVLLTGCKEKSLQTEMPAPSISVATPVVQDITLTKDYPGYLSSDRSTRERIPAILTTCAGCKSKKGRPDICNRTGSLPEQCHPSGSRAEHGKSSDRICPQQLRTHERSS